MKTKRIAARSSRTAEWTCICRAASSLEKDPRYRSDDHIALRILPPPIKTLIQLPLYRALHCRVGAPKGIYEYVIARTKYMDAAYRQAIAERVDRVAILGAGFDSRAIRFPAAGDARIYEFDSPNTQQTKLAFYRRNAIAIPPNVTLAPIDFERESLAEKLAASGFARDKRCLFLMEGVLMYLAPEAAHDTFLAMSDVMGEGSRVVFDYVYADVLGQAAGRRYGGVEITRAVSRAREAWQFGVEKDGVAPFLANYGLRLIHHLSASEMEEAYFRDERGRIAGRVNGAHCLATAAR